MFRSATPFNVLLKKEKANAQKRLLQRTVRFWIETEWSILGKFPTILNSVQNYVWKTFTLTSMNSGIPHQDQLSTHVPRIYSCTVKNGGKIDKNVSFS